MSGYYLDSIRQPMWTVQATGSNLDKQADLQRIVESTLQELCDKGLDKELLEASLNSIEFALRESVLWWSSNRSCLCHPYDG